MNPGHMFGFDDLARSLQIGLTSRSVTQVLRSQLTSVMAYTPITPYRTRTSASHNHADRHLGARYEVQQSLAAKPSRLQVMR